MPLSKQYSNLNGMNRLLNSMRLRGVSEEEQVLDFRIKIKWEL